MNNKIESSLKYVYVEAPVPSAGVLNLESVCSNFHLINEIDDNRDGECILRPTSQ